MQLYMGIVIKEQHAFEETVRNVRTAEILCHSSAHCGLIYNFSLSPLTGHVETLPYMS